MPNIIAFIGAGNMAGSLIGGLVADGYDPQCIWAANPSQEKLNNLREQLNIRTTQDNQQAVAAADIVVFAVKPQKLADVARGLAKALEAKLIMTVVAGISTAQLKIWLDNDRLAIVRCMPNTPSLIRAGITGLYARQPVTEAQKKQAESIMQAVGSVLWVEKEELIDTVAALSGSGPAYFFKVMEALQAGAEKLGLPSEQAKMLTLQTALGAAKMAATSTRSLKALREQVTSKNGMTAKALQVLETGGMEQLLYEALFAGQQRAHEMAEELKNQ